MRALTLTALIAGSLLATSTVAQETILRVPDSGEVPGAGISEINGRTSGLVSTTPSRLTRSRNEMNRGRNPSWAANPTPSQLRAETERALRNGGLHCTIAELDMVSQLRDGTPVVEVACVENGGLVIANSNPIQVNDCFDLADGTGAVGPCRLPKNVALVAANPDLQRRN